MTRLKSLERWSATAFLVGGAMFAVSAALVVAEIVVGAERLSRFVGEAFIGAGWTAALVGLLGLYPGLADRSRWLSRAGAISAVLGVVTFVGLTVVSLNAYVTGGSLEDIPVALILPGVIIGSLLAFVSFSAAILRTDVHSRTLGVLLLGPSLVFVTNFLVLPAVLESAPPTPPWAALAITGLLTVAMLAIGYVLRTSDGPTERRDAESPGDVRA